MKSGETYKGNFLLGRIHGFGIWNYKNGDIYEGEWEFAEYSG